MLNVVELNVKEFESRWVDGPFGTRSKRRGGRDLKDLEYIMQTVINTGWATFGSTLRRLKLHFPHYCYSALGPTMPSTTALVFPHLEELDIASYTFKFLHDQVIPFINNHHSTLKVLTLRFIQVAPIGGSVEACSWIPAIRTIPNLKKFDFYHSIEREKLGASQTILVHPHSTGLQMLHLQAHSGYTHDPDEDDDHSHVPIPIPCLESLAEPVCFTVVINNVAADTDMYMPSFSTLNLERVCLVLEELKKLNEALLQLEFPDRLEYWICGCHVPIT
jgi:hypothetical protein